MPERLQDSAGLIATPTHRSLPASGRAGLAVVIGAGLAGFVTQWAAVILWVPPVGLSTVWLQGGVMLAMALLTTPRRWPAILLAAGVGQALLFLGTGVVPPFTAIALPLLGVVVAATVAGVCHRVLRQPFTLGSFSEFLAFLGVVVVGGALLAATVLILGALVLGFRPPTFLVWRTFALSAVLGYLVVTPTIVLLVRETEQIRRNTTVRRISSSLCTP